MSSQFLTAAQPQGVSCGAGCALGEEPAPPPGAGGPCHASPRDGPCRATGSRCLHLRFHRNGLSHVLIPDSTATGAQRPTVQGTGDGWPSTHSRGPGTRGPALESLPRGLNRRSDRHSWQPAKCPHGSLTHSEVGRFPQRPLETTSSHATPGRTAGAGPSPRVSQTHEWPDLSRLCPLACVLSVAAAPGQTPLSNGGSG